MNSVVLIGRLVRDVELSYTQSQMAVAKFTIAVDRITRANEEKKADFIRIVVFGKQAEVSERYLAKGRQVAVQGRIQTGSYTNRDGQTVYTTDVVADRIEFIGSAGSSNNNGGQRFANSNDDFDASDVGFDDDNNADVISESFRETSDDVPF